MASMKGVAVYPDERSGTRSSITFIACTAIKLLPKSPSNGGVALLGKTTQNGFVDFQLVSTELYRSENLKYTQYKPGFKICCIMVAQ